MTEPISVVLVEDHPTFRLGLRARLELEDDLRVVGEAGTGQHALEVVGSCVPDVAVVDLNLPGLDGIAVIRELRTIAPEVRVLVLTMLDDESVIPAVRAGARGYLLKDAEPGRIVAAIRAVAAGEVVYTARVAERLLSAPTTPDGRRFGDLSERETQILSLAAEGLTNLEIGRRLGLRPKTVRNYVSNVIGKLHAADRAEAIQKARDGGITP